jgi:hypothetical protein
MSIYIPATAIVLAVGALGLYLVHREAKIRKAGGRHGQD